jgi:CRP/FNR family transcriptional regulator
MKSLKINFPDFSKELIQDIETYGVIQKYAAGEIIIRTGQFIRNTALVMKGKIKIYREGEDGGEFFLYYLQPGQACAISMICTARSEKSEVMAKIVEDAELILVPLPQMDQWMMQYRSWYEFVMETYRERFEEVLLVIDNIAFKALDERLEFYLKRQKNSYHSNDLKISHQEIANDLNTSREVISRLLKKMEQQGFLKLHRSHIEWIKL